jgi:sterol desaturase/sphingolipid hydroxylase (fatty acid hydroxylase superfamily)
MESFSSLANKRSKRSRIFNSDLMEYFTLVNWYTPFIVWIPLITFLFLRSYQQDHLGMRTYFFILFVGILLWSLAEYFIHRYLFHFKCKSKFGQQMVYTIHGNHHDDPMDPLRGVMPILPAGIYIIFLYFIFSFLTPHRYLDVLFGSFLIGYLLYDGIHYYTHHGNPQSKIGKYLRKAHLIHHVHPDVMFGISSPFWDIIFGTFKRRN